MPSKELLDFVTPPDANYRNFIHRTDSEHVAKKIKQEGFYFKDFFAKTTDEVENNIIYLEYWLKIREHYGHNVVVLSFNWNLLQNYELELKKNLGKFAVQYDIMQVISEPLDTDDPDHLEYMLPRQYVKGYFNTPKNSCILNSAHNPHFYSRVFEENLRFLKRLHQI